MPKDSSTPYEQLSIYDRTFIESAQAFIRSGNFAPGALILQLAKDFTDGTLTELGYTLPAPADLAIGSYEWLVWGPNVR